VTLLRIQFLDSLFVIIFAFTPNGCPAKLPQAGGPLVVMAFKWHILSLSIRNFLSIRRLNNGQTSSPSTYFWLTRSRSLPLPATRWRAQGRWNSTWPTPNSNLSHARPVVSFTQGTWFVWHRPLIARESEFGVTPTCTTRSLQGWRGGAGIRTRPN